ncbi:regulatory protein RecX [Hippea maritima]|uniref:Regulatory protein RecX n=1 Tax=Hippea maritima (strain ATCC 700847 / DSM 10411 / MH2) TaxID=760142 RepID=F2LXW2_HIPMA|nr:regulatory protein RecX [Hippea maritima]AEA33227.1 Regulatory protein recX [Hippea maritima DSM 10411]
MNYKEALRYAFNLLARRDYSTKEVESRLQKKGVCSSDIEKIVKSLKENGFLNDKRYAETYAFFRLKKGYGKLRIRHELALKGIDESIIDNVLTEEAEEAEGIFLKKLKLLKNKPNARKKLFDFMYRRGFDKDTIVELLNKYDVKEKENEIV